MGCKRYFSGCEIKKGQPSGWPVEKNRCGLVGLFVGFLVVLLFVFLKAFFAGFAVFLGFDAAFMFAFLARSFGFFAAGSLLVFAVLIFGGISGDGRSGQDG